MMKIRESQIDAVQRKFLKLVEERAEKIYIEEIGAISGACK